MPPNRKPLDWLPDVRDGLTRVQRIILWQLHELQKERDQGRPADAPPRMVPSAQLYGRVVDFVDLSVPEFERLLASLVGRR